VKKPAAPPALKKEAPADSEASAAEKPQREASRKVSFNEKAASHAEMEVKPLLAGSPESGSSKASSAGGISPEMPEDTDTAELEAAWQEVGQQTEVLRERELANARNGVVKVEQDIGMRPISYKEVETWFRQAHVDNAVLQRLYDEDAGDDGVACGCFSGPKKRSDVPGLDRRHTEEKDRLLFFSMNPFDLNELPHIRMLRTMYLKLTRNKSCPTIGGHWQQIGFQNTDPRMDLNRSGGVLNVIHLFYFFSHYFDICKEAYLLAQDPEQNFPLASVSINITGMVMERLNSGQLSSLCNRDNGVFDTICRIYSGAIHLFYRQWRSQKRTIQDAEKTFKEVRASLQSRPKSLLDELSNAVKERQIRASGQHLEYTDLAFGSSGGQPPRTPPRQGGPAAALEAIPRRLQNYSAGAAGDDDG
jgi:hypothetical protein